MTLSPMAIVEAVLSCTPACQTLQVQNRPLLPDSLLHDASVPMRRKKGGCSLGSLRSFRHAESFNYLSRSCAWHIAGPL